MDSDELRPADEAILDVLEQGRATTGYVIDETGYHRSTISTRLEILDEAGHLELIHEPTSLWELVDEPRER